MVGRPKACVGEVLGLGVAVGCRVLKMVKSPRKSVMATTGANFFCHTSAYLIYYYTALAVRQVFRPLYMHHHHYISYDSFTCLSISHIQASNSIAYKKFQSRSSGLLTYVPNANR